MHEEPYVSVRGRAVLNVAPELVTARATIRAKDRRRERVQTLLMARGEEIGALLDTYGDKVAQVDPAALLVYPEYSNDRQGEQLTGYQGSLTWSLTMDDFVLLSDVLACLAEQHLAEISAPEWALRPDSPVYAEARAAAVADALTRAREYADAMGADLTSLVAIADRGLLGMGVPTASASDDTRVGCGVSSAAPTSSPGLSADREPLDIAPVRQLVRVQIEARFTMGAPDLWATSRF